MTCLCALLPFYRAPDSIADGLQRCKTPRWAACGTFAFGFVLIAFCDSGCVSCLDGRWWWWRDLGSVHRANPTYVGRTGRFPTSQQHAAPSKPQRAVALRGMAGVGVGLLPATQAFPTFRRCRHRDIVWLPTTLQP